MNEDAYLGDHEVSILERFMWRIRGPSLGDSMGE